MNTQTMASYRPFQRLHPLTLLAQLSSRQASGCLQVSNGSITWSIYLEQGKLIYATNSSSPFERLDRHLRHLSQQVPSLVSAVRVQVRLLFDRGGDAATEIASDFQAICWLVDQEHLSTAQAGDLVESLAKEVLDPFLSIQEGSHELIPLERMAEVPRFCQIDLRSIVEQCQSQARQKQISSLIANRIAERASTATQNGTTPSLNQNSSQVGAEANEPTQPPAASSTDERKTQVTKFNTEALPLPSGKGTYTIACIDDSPTVLQAIRSFLDDKTFTVLMIDNPVKALMQIIRSKPDLILLDVTMPNLDGYELCSLLRKHPHFKHTPVVMVTGNTGFIDRAKARLVGASGYLTKPFTQSDLVKMVFKHLV